MTAIRIGFTEPTEKINMSPTVILRKGVLSLHILLNRYKGAWSTKIRDDANDLDISDGLMIY